MKKRYIAWLLGCAGLLLALGFEIERRGTAPVAPAPSPAAGGPTAARAPPRRDRARPLDSPLAPQRPGPGASPAPASITDLIATHGPAARMVFQAQAPVHADLSNVQTGAVFEAAELVERASDEQCNTIDGTGGCADPLPNDRDRDGHPSQTDCDDLVRDVHPGGRDIACNGLDEDCSGSDHCPSDLDGDGDHAGHDCDDRNPLRNMRAEEIACNGIDEDCSGADVCDADGDGDPAPNDCDDRNASRHQRATDVICDGIDQDCTGVDCCNEDRDGDGHPCRSDCDDDSARIHPGAPMPPRCTHTDVDCDGKPDACSPSRPDIDMAPSP